MALNGWNQQENLKNITSGNRRLSWFKDGVGKIILFYPIKALDTIPNSFTIRIIDKFDDNWVDKTFKTKSQALAFAKRYMRSH